VSDKKGQAEAAIREVFGDTSVPPTTTIERLEELRDLCDELIETLKEDIGD
jgi:hypothetical protein